MRGDLTRHTAHASGDGWRVTWLPGRPLNRNAAITAMSIAETVAAGPEPGHPIWCTVSSWAAELGLSGAEAVSLVSATADEPGVAS